MEHPVDPQLVRGVDVGGEEGGLGLAVILVSTVFAATTGIVGASVVTMGMLSLPILLRSGYKPSLACGMALGDKLKGRDSRVFLIVGDGESNEGQVWEAMAFASAKKLDNLVVLLDWNKRQLDGWTEDIYPMGDYVAKFEAFGFDTVKVDGNDVEAVAEALASVQQGGGRPHAVILDTVKGAGIREVEDTAMNHSLTVSDEQFERWTAQLKAQLAELEG